MQAVEDARGALVKAAELAVKQDGQESAGARALAEAAASLKTQGEAFDQRLRAAERLRWRQWPFGLAIGAASFIFFVVGAVLQQETDVVSLGDPRHEWNEYVEEYYASTLAACKCPYVGVRPPGGEDRGPTRRPGCPRARPCRPSSARPIRPRRARP